MLSLLVICSIVVFFFLSLLTFFFYIIQFSLMHSVPVVMVSRNGILSLEIESSPELALFQPWLTDGTFSPPFTSWCNARAPSWMPAESNLPPRALSMHGESLPSPWPSILHLPGLQPFLFMMWQSHHLYPMGLCNCYYYYKCDTWKFHGTKKKQKNRYFSLLY